MPAKSLSATIQEMYAHLSQHEVVDIIGVVAPSGLGGLGAGPGAWDMMFNFAAWRQLGKELQDNTLHIRKQVQNEEMRALRESIHGYDVIHIRARLSPESLSGRSEALLVEVVGPDAGHNDLMEYALKLRVPVTFEDPQFGTFVLDRTCNRHECRTRWGEHPVRLTIRADDDGNLEQSLCMARLLWASRDIWEKRVLEFMIADLLPTKNDSWLGQGEGRVTPRSFEARVTLDLISISPRGRFTFWYTDGGMFCGHSIRVSGTLSKGPEFVGLEG